MGGRLFTHLSSGYSHKEWESVESVTFLSGAAFFQLCLDGLQVTLRDASSSLVYDGEEVTGLSCRTTAPSIAPGVIDLSCPEFKAGRTQNGLLGNPGFHLSTPPLSSAGVPVQGLVCWRQTLHTRVISQESSAFEAHEEILGRGL